MNTHSEHEQSISPVGTRLSQLTGYTALAVRRALVEQDELEEYSSRYGKLLTAHIEEQKQKLDNGLRTNTEYVSDLSLSGGQLLTESYLKAWQKNELYRPMKPFRITLQPGNQVIGAPYDLSWRYAGTTSQTFKGTTQTVDTLYTFGGEGYEAHGVGVFLDAPIPLSATVMPKGTYEFKWVNFVATNVNLRAQGGLSVIVYEVGDETPIVVQQATLWSAVGGFPSTSGEGSGSIEDVVAFTTDFGNVLLTPVSFDMQAGKRYLFWIWLWEIINRNGVQDFVTYKKVHIPLIVTSAGSPMIIR